MSLSYCGWTISNSHHLETMGKPLFVGIYRGIIIPRFLRCCTISSIHSKAWKSDPCDQKLSPIARVFLSAKALAACSGVSLGATGPTKNPKRMGQPQAPPKKRGASSEKLLLLLCKDKLCTCQAPRDCKPGAVVLVQPYHCFGNIPHVYSLYIYIYGCMIIYIYRYNSCGYSRISHSIPRLHLGTRCLPKGKQALSVLSCAFSSSSSNSVEAQLTPEGT